MDAMQFWDKYPIDHVRKVCATAGTSYEYFKHIAHRRKRPSPELADRLVAASGGKMKRDKLLFSRTPEELGTAVNA